MQYLVGVAGGSGVGTALGQWDRRLLLRALGKVMLVFWRLTLSPWRHLGISRRNWKGSNSGALGSLHKQWMVSCLSYLLLYLEKMYWVVYKEHKLIFSRSRHQCLALQLQKQKGSSRRLPQACLPHGPLPSTREQPVSWSSLIPIS